MANINTRDFMLGEEYEDNGGFEFNNNHLFSIILLVLVLCVLVHLCRKNCDDKSDKEEAEEMKSLVIAQEAKPGYLIIQGNNNEEIFRIIKEYESAQRGSGVDYPASTSLPIASSNAAANIMNTHGYHTTMPPHFTANSLQRSSDSFYSPSTSNGPGVETMRIEYDPSARPPPYAPTTPFLH